MAAVPANADFVIEGYVGPRPDESGLRVELTTVAQRSR